MMGNTDENLEEAPVMGTEDVTYVLVGKDMKESKLTLEWALRNSGGRKICMLYVHQPAKAIPISGQKISISYMDEKEVRAYHESEKRNMHQLLDTYSHICEQAGVQAEKLYIEMDSIEEGIVKLISQYGIRKLVMGAAADKLYSKKMKIPKSRGNFIYTREVRLDGGDKWIPIKEIEEARARLARTKEELKVALKQKSYPESQIANSDKIVQELETKISSAAELVLNYKKELYELQAERDNALREAEELTKKIAETTSCTRVHQFFFLTLVIFCFIYLLYAASIGVDSAQAQDPYSIE